MDHACLHRTIVKDNSKPRLSMDIAVMVDSEYSHANGEGFDPKAYNYYEPKTIQLIGEGHNYEVKESIHDSANTTTLSIGSTIC